MLTPKIPHGGGRQEIAGIGDNDLQSRAVRKSIGIDDPYIFGPDTFSSD
jgi:hypothetical protein